MDLYADLPLAKGASTSALDADGKPKNPTSVWKTTPLMVPQVMRNAQANAATNKGKNGAATQPPTINTTSMLPTALAGNRSKSPHAGTTPTRIVKKTPTGIPLAFKPSSITRKVSTTSSDFGDSASETSHTGIGVGLAFSTVTEVRISQENGNPEQQAANSSAPTSVHFFQATYRDEYNPARPNSYEAYCNERLNIKKMEQVKRELERRQQKQEREGKREREKLVKDLNAGIAPAIELPAAGRGRGMTVPAWMRKKIEESTRKQEIDNDKTSQNNPLKSAEEGQFADPEPRTGLGFSQPISETSSPRGGLGFFRSETQDEKSVSHRESSRSEAQSNKKDRDEFGRDIQWTGDRQHSPDRKRDRDSYHGREDRRTHDRDNRHEHSHERYERNERNERYNSHSRNAGERREEKRQRVNNERESLPDKRPSHGTVILLQNMVGPGEVDDELQDEVKEECAEKYGAVEKCIIYEVTDRVSVEEAVRIFVKFEHANDAAKAIGGLNGRFFGGRKVKASYYDDDKFARLDLAG